MKLLGAWLCGLAMFAWSNGAAALNPAAIETANLSSCGTACTTSVLAKYSCTNNDACFCANTQIRVDISSCLAECPFSDRFYFSAARAKICNTPVDSQGASLSGTAYALFAIATIITTTRLLSRWNKLGGEGYWWDDYVALLAYPFLIALTASQALAVQAGTGRDLWGLTLDDFKDVLYWLYISNVLWTPIVFFTKISLVFLYLRLWNAAGRFRLLCLGVLGSLVVGYFVFQIVAIVQCSPVSYAWNRVEDAKLVEAHLADAVQGSCIDQQGWLWGSSALMIVFDLMVALLPVVKLLQSSMSRVNKTGVALTYLFGLVVLASGFARFAFISKFSSDRNPSSYYIHFHIIAMIEANFSQVVCCMPALSVFFNEESRRHKSNHGRSTPFNRLNNFFTYRKPVQADSGRETPDNEKPPTSSKSFFTKQSSFASSPASQMKPQTPRQYLNSGSEPLVRRMEEIVQPEDAPVSVLARGWHADARRSSPSPFFHASDRDEETGSVGKGSMGKKESDQSSHKSLKAKDSAVGPFLPGDGYTAPSPSIPRSSEEEVDTALPPPPIVRGPSPALVLPAKDERKWSGLSSLGKSKLKEDHVRISEEGEDSDAALPPPISRGPSPAMVGRINENKEKRTSGLRIGAGSSRREAVARGPSSQVPQHSDDDSDSAFPPPISRGPSPLPTSTSKQEKRLSGLRVGANSRQSVRSPSLLASPPLGDDSSDSSSDYGSDTALPPPPISRGPSPLPGAQPAPLKAKKTKEKRLSKLIGKSSSAAPAATDPESDPDTAIPSPLFSHSTSSMTSSQPSTKRHSSLRGTFTSDRVRSPIIFEEQPRISEADDEGDEADNPNLPAFAPIVPRVSSPEPGPHGRPPSRKGSKRHSTGAFIKSMGMVARSSSRSGSRDGRLSTPPVARPGSAASGWKISDDEVKSAVEEGREKRMSGMVGGAEDLVPFAKNGKGVDAGRTEEWVNGRK